MVRRTSARYDIEARDRTARGVNSAKRNLTSLNRAVAIARVGVAGLTAGVLTYGAALASGVRELDNYNRRLQQTDALLKQTGFSAGLTSRELQSFADTLARTTLADEVGVQEAINQLLTFRSIQGELFKETIRLAQDLASAGFGSITSSTLVLAKALEDPIAQLGSLSRVGITLSQQQKELVKDFANTGQKARAQGLILQALRDQIGGTATAETKESLAGATDGLSQSWRELQRTLADGSAFNNSVRFVNALQRQVDKLNQTLSLEGQLERLERQISEVENAIEVSPNSRLADSRGFVGGEEDRQARLNTLRREQLRIQGEILNQGFESFSQQTLANQGAQRFNEEAEKARVAAEQAEAAEKATAEAIEAKAEAQRLFNQRKEEEIAQISRLQDSINADAERFAAELQTEEQRIQSEINILRSLRGTNNPNITDDQIDTLIARRIEQQQVLGTEVDRVTEAQERLNDKTKEGVLNAQELSDIFTRAAIDATDEWENLGDVIDNVGRNLLATLTRTVVTEPLNQAIGSVFGSIFEDLIPNASGRTFSVQGGSGERPVTVSAQQGEIVEVRSGRQGASSGGTVINVINNSNARVSPTATNDGGREQIQILIEDVAAQSMINGKVAAAAQQRFQLQGALTPR